MTIGQCVCSSLTVPCKLHAALSADVLCTKIHSDNFNGSEHPKVTNVKNSILHACVVNFLREFFLAAFGLSAEICESPFVL